MISYDVFVEMLHTVTASKPLQFKVAQTDAWIVSDAPDFSGNVIADCGPSEGARP